MSVPHTGKLLGLVNGTPCAFDGERWTSSDAPSGRTLTAALNAATASAPRSHFDIRSLAEHVCRKLELPLEITEWTPDAWPAGDDVDGVD